MLAKTNWGRQRKTITVWVGKCHFIDELNQNSIAYLLEKAEIFLPIIIILFILASVSSISSSALIVRKKSKKLCPILYQRITVGTLFLCQSVAFYHFPCHSYYRRVVALLTIPHTKFAYMVKYHLESIYLRCFAAMIILQLLISMIMPLIIIGKNTPKQILTK